MRYLSHPVFKRHPIPFGRLAEMPVPHPERTAYRLASAGSWDYLVAEWPTVEARDRAVFRTDTGIVGAQVGWKVWRGR